MSGCRGASADLYCRSGPMCWRSAATLPTMYQVWWLCLSDNGFSARPQILCAGVKGVGLKSAVALLQEYEDVETVLLSASEVSTDFPVSHFNLTISQR